MNTPFHARFSFQSLGRLATLITISGWLTGRILAADAEEGPKIQWQEGPSKAALQQTAHIEVPAGFRFANGDDTRRLLQAMREPVSGREMGMIVSSNKWSVFFDFSPDGYVKDDDKDKLDADKLLKAIIKGNDHANEERARNGVPPLKITGWEKPPFYDEATHNLEWAIRAESDGRPIINYNVRLLGRRGVMEVVLVCSPEKLPETLPTYKELLTGYAFSTGESYAEYKPGDKLAKYGLAALVTGGAVAIAAKTGLIAWIVLMFKKFGKVLVVAVIAIGAFFKRLIHGRGRSSSTPQ